MFIPPMFGMGKKLNRMGVQPDAGQGMGNFNNGMMQGMGNAAGMAASIGPSMNLINKIKSGGGFFSKLLGMGGKQKMQSNNFANMAQGLAGAGQQMMPQMQQMPQQIEQAPMGADGTAPAMAPEQGMGQSVGPSMDIGQLLQKFGNGQKKQGNNSMFGMFG